MNLDVSSWSILPWFRAPAVIVIASELPLYGLSDYEAIDRYVDAYPILR